MLYFLSYYLLLLTGGGGPSLELVEGCGMSEVFLCQAIISSLSTARSSAWILNDGCTRHLHMGY